MIEHPRIAWLPLAAIAVAGQSAHAVVYLSTEQAQQQLFAGQVLTPLALAPSPADIAAIEAASGSRYLPGALRVWQAADGWFCTDAVVGKHDLIHYAVALTRDGKVRQVEILEYRESYGGEVRNAAWLQQFAGRGSSDPLRVGQDIQNISGATLSSQHVTDGIRRLLAVHARLLAER